MNPLQSDIAKANVLEQEKNVNEVIDENDGDDTLEEIDDQDDEDIPQAYNNSYINKYLDLKLGKASIKSSVDIPKREFFKFYVDSSLPPGCRIVHKKSPGSIRVEYSYRSKCGRFFDSKSDLISYVENCEKVPVFKKTPLFINMYKKQEDLEIPPQTASKLVEKGKENANAFKMKLSQNAVSLKMKNAKALKNSDIKLTKKHQVPKPNVAQSPSAIPTSVIPKTGNSQKQEPSSNQGKKTTKHKGKTCRCDECNLTLSMNDITLHIVKVHPGQKMNRCAKCKSGLMNDKSFKAHHSQYHADQKSSSDLEKVAV